MKTIITLMCVAVLCGCASQPNGSIPEKDQRCEFYANALALYQASTVFRQPTADEIKGAQAATLFLTASCGWQKTRAVDAWGVPVVANPYQ